MLPVRWTARAITWLVFALAIVASVAGIAPAHVSDLPVTYAVQDKSLKQSAVAGTPLTFTPTPSVPLRIEGRS